MKLWLYYTRLAIQDLVRLWPGTQHHVIIVAGICLPILLLLGLKRGHVADLRRELLTSPTGRQVVFWSAQQGELLTREGIARIRSELLAVDVVIPEMQRLVRFSSLAPLTDGEPASQSATLYATCAGDPILAQVHGDVLGPGERAVVMPDTLAEKLAVTPGGSVRMTVDRERGGVKDSASVEVTVKAVVTLGGDKTSIAYADSQLLDWLEQYVRGFHVESLDWPALSVPVRDRYAAYLLFCEAQSDLSREDIKTIEERGLKVEPVDDPKRKSLHGLLKANLLGRLRMYRLASISSESDPKRRLVLAPSEIAELTVADDVVLPWNEPQDIAFRGKSCRMIGLSLPRRSWFREYLIDPEAGFDYESPTEVARVFHVAAPLPEKLPIPLHDGQSLALAIVRPPAKQAAPAVNRPTTTVKPVSGSGEKAPKPAVATPVSLPATASTPTASEGALAVVPAPFLAQLDAGRQGLAVYDPGVKLFVPVAEDPTYDKARLYASTIDDVPQVAAELMGRKFAVMSENARVTEIHQQDRSLQLLVYVVGIGVFLFGIVTVFSVLLESTDRKRGTIGILRVMGVSRLGIFYLVSLRAAVIGVLAGAVSGALGWCVAMGLAYPVAPEVSWHLWKPTITVVLDPADLMMVFTGALVCSGLGAIIPGWRASRMDPFDAIVEGRFR